MRVARNRHRFRRRIELCAKLIKYCLEPVHRIKIKWCFSGVESRTQGSRPRTQKDFEAKAKDTDASVLQKKKGPQKFFSGDLKKKGLQNFFSGEKCLKKFFSGDLYLGKPKKGLCRFSARFLAFSKEILTV